MADSKKLVLMGHIRAYLQPFSTYYPDIERWFEKVGAEAVGGRRRIFALRVEGQLSGLAITRLGQKAKLCHFSLSPSVRGLGLGRRLMTLAMGDLLASGALAIHVTASDEVAEPYGAFFNRCGFDLSAYIRDCYRHGSDELIFTATPESLRSHLTSHLHIDGERHSDPIHLSIGQAGRRLIPSRSETGFILVDTPSYGFPQSDGEQLARSLTCGEDD